jgi:O-antigen/teichoic acid export membrane protein
LSGAVGSVSHRVTAYLKRLLASSAAYQTSSLMSAGLAVITLPLYTRHLTTADYGYAETLLTFIILASIVLRLGIGEAFVRFWFDDSDQERRVRLARATTRAVLLSSTAATLVALALAGPLAQLLLNKSDAGLMRLGLLGLWAFTNLEVAYSLLRVEERRREYVIAGVANVLMTVGLTATLVVGFDGGARGYVLGNYGASTIVLLGLWFTNRELIGVSPRWAGMPLGPLLRFGAPTVGADATVFALNVIDRAYLLRAQSAAAAGVYAVAVKLATAVIVAVRGFQAAWPPLAYSVTDDAEARRLYAFVTTAYVAVTGIVVAAITLEGRWLVRLLAAPAFFGAHAALPWLALGWALYGLNLVFLTIAGRAKVTTRNFAAASAGVFVNVLVLVALVPSMGIRGAGIALCASYLVMLVVIHLLTRNLFTVPFEWARLAQLAGVMGGMSVAGELLLPVSGLGGFATRALVLAAIPVVLLTTGFVSREERARVAALVRARRGGPSEQQQ